MARATNEPHDPRDDEALSWGDERDPSLVTTRAEADPPVGSATPSDRAPDSAPDSAPDGVGAGSAVLVFYGAAAGVYVLYTVGWVLAALADSTPSVSVFAQLMHEFGLFCAIVAPALWVLAVFALARRAATRVLGLALGAVLLVPWPFVLGLWAR